MTDEFNPDYEEPTDEELDALDSKKARLTREHEERKLAEAEQHIVDQVKVKRRAEDTTMSAFMTWLDEQPWTPKSQDAYNEAFNFLLSLPDDE